MNHILTEKTQQSLVAESVQSGKAISVVLSSGSMRPLISQGTAVDIHPLRREVEPGDIVLSTLNQGGARLHRVVSRGADQVLTKGDSNPHPDPPCSIDDIVGICVAINGHRIDTPTWRFVNRQIAKISPYSHQLRAPLRLLGRVRRALGLWWL